MATQPASTDPIDGPVDHRANGALAWYGLGASLLGLAIGMMAGLSESPIVAVLIPLLFSLLTAGGGFFLATADTTQHTVRQRILHIGKILSAFAILTLVGVIYGVMIRTGASIRDLVPSISESPSIQNDNAELYAHRVQDTLELLALRLRLRLLDVPPNRRSDVLLVAEKELNETGSHRIATVAQGVATAAAAASALLPSENFDTLDAASQNNYKSLQDKLFEVSERYAFVAGSDSIADVDESRFSEQLKDDDELLRSLMGSVELTDETRWQLKYDKLRYALIALEIRIQEHPGVFEPNRWRIGQDTADGIDRLLEIAASPNQEPPPQLTPRPRPAMKY